MFKRKKWGERNKIIVLLDFENIQMRIPSPERFSVTAGFDRLNRQIAQEVGDIINTFVFVPPHAASICAKDFYEQGFFTVLCPKIRDKTGAEQDTVDATLIEFGKKVIEQIPDLTHLCIGSGDKDFSPLIREAIRHRLKIIIIAGDLRSLSANLITLADSKPDGGKMVYIFSPTTEE